MMSLHFSFRRFPGTASRGSLSTFVLLGVLAMTGCSRTETKVAQTADTPQPVEVTSLVRRDLAETLNLVGSLAANESATIRPELNGLVRSIHFEEGQRVKKGDLLVKIEDSEVRAQFTQAEARYKLAELNLQRAEKLGTTQSNSLADIDRARSEFSSAKSELDLIKVRLDRTEIRAPFDGMVGARTISPGDYVNSQSVITTIDDLSRLKIDFQVPERFVAKVGSSTPFKVRSQALARDREVTGEVYFVASVVDRATRSSEVKGIVVSDATGLKPGMFANVELVLEVKRGVLTVPEGSILSTTSGTQLVAVKKENDFTTVEFIPVRTGVREKGLVEVAAVQGELSETMQVVASGVGALVLFPGMRIEPRPVVDKFLLSTTP